jgi:hypothetical protein
MRFLQTVRASVRSPEFYDGLIARPFSFSLKYFLTLNLFLAFLLTVVYSVSLVPAGNAFLHGIRPAMQENFPDALVLTVKGGKASVNVTEPYAITLPDELTGVDAFDKFANLKNLLVIDTTGPFSLERFSSYETLMLLTGDALITRTDEGKLEVQELAGIPDVTIDKARALRFASRLESLARWAAPLVIFALFAGFFAFLNFRLAYLIPGAFVVWGIGRMKKRAFSYGASYRIALHAVTLAALVDAARVALVLPKIPYLFTVIFLFAVWMNLKGESAPGQAAAS